MLSLESLRWQKICFYLYTFWTLLFISWVTLNYFCTFYLLGQGCSDKNKWYFYPTEKKVLMRLWRRISLNLYISTIVLPLTISLIIRWNRLVTQLWLALWMINDCLTWLTLQNYILLPFYSFYNIAFIGGKYCNWWTFDE